MEQRYATSPDDYTRFDTESLRGRFLLEGLFQPGAVELVYSHEDRIVLGGAVPLKESLSLPAADGLYADTFCQRRELAVTNLGGAGTVIVDGMSFDLGREDVLYVGRGSLDVVFQSVDPGAPANYYLFSAIAHTTHPTELVRRDDADATTAGDGETANRRTIRKYVHQDGVRSDQIVLGITSLEPGSVWNTMPCHTHERRTEVYLYFGLGPDGRVIHLMGRPEETRDLVVADNQAVISPSWSVHTGAGTSNYAFVWAMAGENQEFSDMQHVSTSALR